jgi:hypothetical protein
LVFKRMARTRVASPFATASGALWRTQSPHLTPLPLAKGRGETNVMELTIRRALPRTGWKSLLLRHVCVISSQSKCLPTSCRDWAQLSSNSS